MKRSLYLKILSGVMAVIFPAALFAADSGTPAMLYTHGVALLNGSSVPRSSAVFSGDVVQTGGDSVANINATGSTVLVLNDSLVQYEGSMVRLEHGGVTISTSKLLSTQVGGVSVSPAAGVWTEFRVKDVDGTIQIAAEKGDLTISDQSGTVTLAQGQETTRDESQEQSSNRKKKRGAVPAAVGSHLDSPLAIGIAGGVVIGLTAWSLAQGDDPVSPSR